MLALALILFTIYIDIPKEKYLTYPPWPLQKQKDVDIFAGHYDCTNW